MVSNKKIFLTIMVVLATLAAVQLYRFLTSKGKLNMSSNKVLYEFHHIGIPTTEPKEGEKYSPTLKFSWTRGNNEHRIQWHRFDKDCPLHPLAQTVPHVAFKVSNLDEAIKGKEVILDPYYPFEGFKVAIVVIEGAPVEYIETNLSEEEIWADTHKNSVLNPD